MRQIMQCFRNPIENALGILTAHGVVTGKLRIGAQQIVVLLNKWIDTRLHITHLLHHLGQHRGTSRLLATIVCGAAISRWLISCVGTTATCRCIGIRCSS